MNHGQAVLHRRAGIGSRGSDLDGSVLRANRDSAATPVRTSGNYRHYDDGALERLRFIKAAQATGFQLDDVRMLLELADGETSRCGEVQTLIEERWTQVATRLRDLRHVQSVFRKELDVSREAEATGRCEVIDLLRVGKPVSGPSRQRKKS